MLQSVCELCVFVSSHQQCRMKLSGCLHSISSKWSFQHLGSNSACKSRFKIQDSTTHNQTLHCYTPMTHVKVKPWYIYTWNTLSLHWKLHPRPSRCLQSTLGNEDLNDAWSFTLVSPPHAKSAAASPRGVNPLRWSTVMLCRQLMLARDNSPTSVTDVYDRFICTLITQDLLLVDLDTIDLS